MSERYPLCSELVDGNRIPEYDNLYLDMNGIIHNCSHSDQDDPSYRITETQIFLAIFNYIDYIFATIRPQKLFMLAVDGVAPRAKMNQQRARRFRTALDAKQKEEKALKAGTILPPEPPFDSNCITPGTPFMARLQDQLTYYINKKISEDAAWRDVKVILSGHNVPGEGEHKIMEYIRAAKATPDYDPNTRHCLYGLDADLIMLGLLSHEPHFSLLREEVTFGRKPRRVKGAKQNFFLLHLSLLREYLSCEFQELQNSLTFEYDFERILDDFILMAYFVGNDFLPHLPGLHIRDGAFSTLYSIYKKILPQCGGYLNEHGYLHVPRCKLFFKELYQLEVEEFESFKGDKNWLSSKKQQVVPAKKSEFFMTTRQKLLYDKVKEFATGPRSVENVAFDWSSMKAQDRSFMLKLVANLGLRHDLAVLEGFTELLVEWDSDDDESDEESFEARQRIISKYDASQPEQELTAQEMATMKEQTYKKQFEEWKWDYYKQNLDVSTRDTTKVDSIVYSYVEGLQWVLLYYYSGVPSWEWFYPYHYAPRISDLVEIDGLKFNFELGKPFYPFEQLMAVLPPLSKQHVPVCLQDLMTDPHSPIIDFYPLEFELDKSGKKADWEAIVKIPFIEEKRLLKAVRSRNQLLSKEEKVRNSLGDATLFEFTSEPTHFPSQLPAVFPDITQCFCDRVSFKIPKLPPGVRVNVLCRGGRIGKDLLAGFPSLDTIPHSFTIGHHGVNLFNSDSKNPSVVVSLENVHEGKSPEDLAMELIGQNMFSGWPFLIESKVMALSDDLFVYTKEKAKNGKVMIVKTPHDDVTGKRHFMSAEKAEVFYSKRCGVLIGEIDMIAKVQVLKGLQLLNDGSFVKEFAPKGDFDLPVQLLVKGAYEDPRFRNVAPPPIRDEFPAGTPVFFLAPKLYGVLGEVLDHQEDAKNTIDLCIQRFVTPELNQEVTVAKTIASEEQRKDMYVPGWQLAKQLQIPSLALSRLTSAFHVDIAGTDKRANLGLNLKHDYRSLKALGYTKKTDAGWEYSKKAFDLLRSYKAKFPSIFERLQRKSDGDFYQDIEFFPNNTQESVEAVKAWLKEQGIAKIVMVPNESVSLSKESILAIESSVDAHLKICATAETELVNIKGVPRKNVLKPAHSRFRLDNQKFSLGDRIISTSDEGAIPLGVKGTVVGIDDEIIEVLFDVPIVGGTDLDGRCSIFRGKQCVVGGLLNLTNIQAPFSTHAPRTEPKNQQKRVVESAPTPPPTTNRWTRGPPTKEAQEVLLASQQPQVQVENMLKTILHISNEPQIPSVTGIPLHTPIISVPPVSLPNQSYPGQPMYVPVPVPVMYTHDQVSEQFLTMLQQKATTAHPVPIPFGSPVMGISADTAPAHDRESRFQQQTERETSHQHTRATTGDRSESTNQHHRHHKERNRDEQDGRQPREYRPKHTESAHRGRGRGNRGGSRGRGRGQ